MKLIWHIIRKDVTRYRWALLAWALLFVAQMGLGFYMLRVDHPGLEEAAWLQRSNWLVVFLQFATGYLLVTQFVQDDALTGTQMFWLTRPISTRRLLAAKVLGVLLVFAVLPLLLLLPWWLYCGFGLRDLAWTAAETLGWQLLMIAPAFLVAALTDEISRVLMWTLLLITGLAAWIIWVQSNLKTALGGPAPSGNTGVMFSRLWLAAMILATGAMAISIHQFLTRRFTRSAVLTIPVLGLIVLVGRFWPWDCSILLTDLNQPEPPPLVSADSFAGVQLALGPAQVRYRDPVNTKLGRRTAILQTLKVQGMPEELSISGMAVGQSWRWPDGSVSAPQSTPFSSWSNHALRKTLALPERHEDPETLRWQQERREKLNADRVAQGLDPFPSWPREADRGAMLGYTRMPDATVARIQAQAPASELRVEAEVDRLQIVLELPLKPGGRGSGDSQTFRITSLFHPREGEHATAQLVLTSPALRSNGLWGVTAIDPATRDRLPELVAANRTVGDSWSAFLRYDEGGEPVNARVGGVIIRWTICGVSSARVIRDGEWVARYPDWFEHTDLVLLTTKPLARFTREVKTEKFELEPSAPINPKPDKSF